MKSVGAAISEPIAQTIGSAFFVTFRSFGAKIDEAPTPNNPETHVTTPNNKEILQIEQLIKFS